VSRENGRWDEVWVYLARDAAGKEWLLHDVEEGRPLVHADLMAALMWLAVAREVAAINPAVTVHLVRFSKRTDQEQIKP
jgi:hypothetical protein